ncbi:response regulator [Sulfurimonas sp. SAG-AH-194-I05]|nr:response regulator [Sulfurimonas sp. SAG-AH-194-I05]MDF1875474.1 response regulator [Sulfurimonas sp. SAG-AH-194-I05]
MKTLNTYYSSKKELIDFVTDNTIKDSESLMIQVFTSRNDEAYIQNLLDILNSLFPKAQLIGSTTDGEIKDGMVSTQSTVLSFTQFENTQLSTYISNVFDDYFDAGEKLAQNLIKVNTQVIISFIDGLSGNGEEFLNGISAVNHTIKVAGGLAGDNATFSKTFVFTKEHIYTNAVAAIALHSDNLNVHTDYSFNWLPIGKSLTITKATSNRVYTINNRTAYETYAYYLGEEVADKLPAIGIEFPLIIQRNGMSIARAVLGKEDDGSLVFAGNLNEGDVVRFGYGDSDSILGYTKENFKNIMSHPVESIFIYSCMARRRFMPDLIEHETIPFSNLATTSGFFTYGEFYSAQHKELLNQTMTLLLLSESNTVNNTICIDAAVAIKSNESDTIKALSHLINIASTELEETNSKLQEETQKALKASKTKSEFLANMSHEIRTPMNGIIGMSHLTLQTDLTQQQEHYVQKIDDSAKALLNIINDILDFSKIEAGKLRIEKNKFNLFTLIDSIVSLVDFKVNEKNLELLVSYSPDLTKDFNGDSLRISQILTNLLSNAIKFTAFGEVGLYISKTRNNKIRFEVKDTGIGLTKEQKSKLFQSFSQADGSTTRKYGGTGLGLSISKQLVELMHGEIWAESVYGIGSTFIFELELEEIDEVKEYTIFKNKKILIVDDSQTWHDILATTLGTFGIEVTSALSGQEALDMVGECDKAFDAILMDWNMPILDGIETTRKLNKCCSIEKPPTVIMVSAFRQESIVKQAKDVGIDIFLQKPINPSLLNNILSSIFLEDKEIVYGREIVEKSLKSELSTLRGSQILLVEDNLTNQEIILGLLQSSGIKIDVANNGKEAVETFQSKEYELIFMDIQMPVMDGIEASKIIRNRDKNIPIIAFTANAMQEDVEKTRRAGMNEHLNKPVDVEKLYSILLKYVTQKTTLSTEIVKDDAIIIPLLENIDTKIGMKYLAGNTKLYIKILNDFAINYKNINLGSLKNEEFHRVIHTLKGLSANIGALKLHEIIKKITSQDEESLLRQFDAELLMVVNEVTTFTNSIVVKNTNILRAITSQERDVLFKELEGAIGEERPQACEAVLEKLLKYKLLREDEIRVKNIINCLDDFDFDEANRFI